MVKCTSQTSLVVDFDPCSDINMQYSIRLHRENDKARD